MTKGSDRRREDSPWTETAAGIMFNWEQFADTLAGQPEIRSERRGDGRGRRLVVREADDDAERKRRREERK